MAEEKLTAFRLPADLLRRLQGSAKARKLSVSAVIREGLSDALHLDPVIEGVIENFCKALNRSRADVIESILVDYAAASTAAIVARPELPVVLPWAALRAGQALRRKELFDVLHSYYLAIARGQQPADVGVKMLSIGPAPKKARIGGTVMPILGAVQGPAPGKPEAEPVRAHAPDPPDAK